MSKKPAQPEDRRALLAGHLARRAIPLLVLILVIAGAVVYLRFVDHAPQHEVPAARGEPIPVTVVTVREEAVPVEMRFLGQTEASQIVEIRSRVAGYLQDRTFTEGQQVERGQTLFQIDPRPFEVALAEAQARLARSEATATRARDRAERVEEAVNRQAASEEELREARMEAHVAEAELALARAQVDAAQLELGYTSIESPITGNIGRALKDIGSYVDSGPSGLLAVVQQIDPMYVRYAVTETEILRFQKQLAAHEIASPEVGEIELQITLVNGEVYPNPGRINFIDVELDETTGTAVVRGEVPNPEGVLKPGQFIYADVLGIRRTHAIRVPQHAVRQSPTGASVFVVDDENMVESRPVELGEWSGTDQWIIHRGLEPGDRVITDRLMMVRPGTPVTIAATAGEEAGDA